MAHKKLDVKRLVSAARFSKYASFNEYTENIKYSNHFYIPLAILEVSLRNSINNHFSSLYGKGWIINQAQFLRATEIEDIDKAIAKIIKRGEAPTQEKVIAELSFGFWTGLFTKLYDKQMRDQNIRQIFPNRPNRDEMLVNRSLISNKLNHIRNYRNRIFHYEKVINKPEFLTIEDDIYMIMEFLDSMLVKHCKRLQRK